MELDRFIANRSSTHCISCQLKVQATDVAYSASHRQRCLGRRAGDCGLTDRRLLSPLRVHTADVENVLALVRVEPDVDHSEPVHLAIGAHRVCVGIAHVVRNTCTLLALVSGQDLRCCRWLIMMSN